MWITNTDYYSKLVILSYDYTKLSSYDHNVTTITIILTDSNYANSKEIWNLILTIWRSSNYLTWTKILYWP